MEKEKIKDFSGESVVEIAEVPAGKYNVRAEFKLRSGEEYALDFDRLIVLGEGEGEAALTAKAMSAASARGLHNFGMDVYIGRYPHGHPVKFTMRHESGQEIAFTRNFDGNGCPVNEKSS